MLIRILNSFKHHHRPVSQWKQNGVTGLFVIIYIFMFLIFLISYLFFEEELNFILFEVTTVFLHIFYLMIFEIIIDTYITCWFKVALLIHKITALSTGAVEYANYTLAEGLDAPHPNEAAVGCCWWQPLMLKNEMLVIEQYLIQ